MRIVCISHGSYDFSDNLAKELADYLGYGCFNRQMMVDKATDFGIPVGKLEVEIVKKKPISEKLGLQIDMYKAFVASELCNRALQEDFVYNGRTSHLALPRVSNILRIRAISNRTDRVQQVMTRLNLSRKIADQYIDQTDQDINRWVRTLYNQDWNNNALYDVMINAENLSSQSTVLSLAQLANLPEFQPTPPSNQVMADLVLSSQCRLAIGEHEKTRHMKVTVKADKGHVTVTYLPQQAQNVGDIKKVLDSIPGVSSYICTVASTNILFIGERFDPALESFNHLVDVAEKWNAAVELVRLVPEKEGTGTHKTNNYSEPLIRSAYDGGILDEGEESDQEQKVDFGLDETVNRLIQVGRAGATYTTHGGIKGMLKDFSNIQDYGLVVVGDVFSSKGVAKQRLKRDLVSNLIEKFKIPVLAVEDLKSQYLFGTKQLISLIGYLICTCLIYFLVFTNQVPILKFVSVGQFGGSLSAKVQSAVVVAILVPIVAFIIGGVYHNLLKMIKLE